MFGTSPEDYTLVFTSGCTAALKLLAQSFNAACDQSKEKKETIRPVDKFSCNTNLSKEVDNNETASRPCSRAVTHLVERSTGVFCFTEDNHTSVIGMTRILLQKGVRCLCLGVDEVEKLEKETVAILARNKSDRFCICGKEIERSLEEATSNISTSSANTKCMPVLERGIDCSLLNVHWYATKLKHIGDTFFQRQSDGDHVRGIGIAQSPNQRYRNNLFIYPLQSNFNGYKYPQQWVELAQEGELFCESGKWLVAVDAASYVSTSSLNLSHHKPDFVALSFYKMFGFPTGLGALLIKNSSAYILEKEYFGGGTVDVSITRSGFVKEKSDIASRFEDGTLPFLEIVALGHSLDYMQTLLGTVSELSLFTHTLTQLALHEMSAMKHGNGAPVFILYHHHQYKDIAKQGPIINFNILKPDGSCTGFHEVDRMASACHVHMRTGCFCNSGACQIQLDMSSRHLYNNYKAGHVCGDTIDLVDGHPTGSCRISFAYYSVLDDVLAFLKFISDYFQVSSSTKNYVANDDMLADIFENVKLQLVEKTVRQGSSSEQQYDSNRSPDVCQPATSISHGPTAADTQAENDNSAIKLWKMFIYPVKSCGAFEVSDWPVTSRGFLYDRAWMVISSNGVCVSQKRRKELCLIKARIDLDKKCLVLSHADQSNLIMDLERDCSSDKATDSRQYRSPYLAHSAKGLDCGDAAANWIQTALSRGSYRLVQQHPPSDVGCGDNDSKHYSLANQAQFLLITTASCTEVFPDRDLNDIVARFRANLIVHTQEAFIEESWSEIVINGCRFVSEGPCMRCHMICYNQATAEQDSSILSALSSARSKFQFGMLFKLVYCQQRSHRISTGSQVKTCK